ncbi:MAG: flavodoxin domain-containing protein [Patescibacteria group bacterium]
MNSILVAYATMTGNTSTVAEAMVQHLVSKPAKALVKLIDLAELTPADLLNYDLIILGSSTWDDGDVNQVAKEFLGRLQADKLDISKLKFAIFGLGDSFYPNFCKAPDVLQTCIADLGGQVVGELLRLDGFPDEKALQATKEWVDSVLELS